MVAQVNRGASIPGSAAYNAAPQAAQNFSPAAPRAPHWEQKTGAGAVAAGARGAIGAGADMAVPQTWQKRAPGSTSTWHFGQGLPFAAVGSASSRVPQAGQNLDFSGTEAAQCGQVFNA